MPRKKGTQPLTLIVVPHSERAPVSICIPAWLLPLLGVLSLALLVGAGLLVVRFYSLERQFHTLQQDRQIQLLRAREMRDTILTQQKDVQGLSQQVENFEAELAGVRTLSDQIRQLIGIPTPTPTSVLHLESSYEDASPTDLLAKLDPPAKGGQEGYRPSERSMVMAVEKSQEVVEMQVTLPRAFRELADLREQVLARMARIEPAQRSNPADLEKQLRLLAAAPHLWPTEVRRISSPFGYRTLQGKIEFHKGIDIPLWYGKVQATQDGIVTVAGWQSSYGWTVEIQHEMGFTTLYGHNSKLLVSKGDEVKAGDVIAVSGNSGRSTGPHLHYEIRLNGTAVDPLKYLDSDVPYVVEK